MMNDWNSENRQLKALVDTERFERGFLELQLKKQDEQITLLSAFTKIINRNTEVNKVSF